MARRRVQPPGASRVKPLTPEDIETNLSRYVEDRRDTARYASFDYCFNYFRSFYKEQRLEAVLAPENLQLSCLHLGFYLASWGMFRGKSHLLQGSMKHYTPLLDVIVNSPDLFTLDVPNYDEGSIAHLRGAFDRVRLAFPHSATETLVTKVMLGVFGCVPAFDTYFKKGFGTSRFGPKSLRGIRGFYDENREVLDRFRIATIDFSTGADTNVRYTVAKVIDMVFFIEGLNRGYVDET
jgi:hypothetical protein